MKVNRLRSRHCSEFLYFRDLCRPQLYRTTKLTTHVLFLRWLHGKHQQLKNLLSTRFRLEPHLPECMLLFVWKTGGGQVLAPGNVVVLCHLGFVDRLDGNEVLQGEIVLLGGVQGGQQVLAAKPVLRGFPANKRVENRRI